jgi:hypothetical protein
MVGVATLQESRSKRERLFALVPILFGAHQFIEGALWLVIARPALKILEQGLTFAYLLIAYCFWPILFPLGLYLLEPRSTRRKPLLWLLGFGAATGLFLFTFVMTGPAQASLVNCSVRYRTNVPDVQWLGLFYVAAVLAPFFLSSYRPLRAIGVINFVFYLAAYFFYSVTFTSVWCFFASALSLNIYFFFRWKHRRKLIPRLKVA